MPFYNNEYRQGGETLSEPLRMSATCWASSALWPRAAESDSALCMSMAAFLLAFCVYMRLCSNASVLKSSVLNEYIEQRTVLFKCQ